MEVLQRDTVNDLVLLEAPQTNDQGIELTPSNDDPPAGIFLIAPATDGAGQVSIVSAKTFRSRKEMSRGFLGVVPATFGKQEGAVLKRSALTARQKKQVKVGDVVTKMNDTEIKTQTDMREFLTKLDPRVTIVVVQRDSEELEKSITLVHFLRNHVMQQTSWIKAGDVMVFRDSASRRNLQPEKCGGPIFDLSEISRHEYREKQPGRSYALPIDVLKAFVDSHDSQHTDGPIRPPARANPTLPANSVKNKAHEHAGQPTSSFLHALLFHTACVFLHDVTRVWIFQTEG